MKATHKKSKNAKRPKQIFVGTKKTSEWGGGEERERENVCVCVYLR
jgi:hypothetical protein